MYSRQEEPVHSGLAGQADLFFQGPVVREQIQVAMGIEQGLDGHGWKHSIKGRLKDGKDRLKAGKESLKTEG